MNNQNHPFINALGQVSDNPSNIHILNMFSPEAAQGHKQLIPQAYAYQATDQGIITTHHAMNLVAAPATHVTTVASTIDAAALYQNQQQQQQHHQQTVAQQQPISYKIPQVCTMHSNKPSKTCPSTKSNENATMVYYRTVYNF